MKHEEVRELLLLHFYGELEAETGAEVDRHLADCPSCSAEWEQVAASLESVSRSGLDAEEFESDLQSARERLHCALSGRRQSETERRKSSSRGWLNWIAQPRLAYAATVLIAVSVGFLAGTWIRSFADYDPLSDPGVRISDIRVARSEADDSSFVVRYSSSRPHEIRGDINDSQIQKLFARALLGESNPGVRLQVVNAIGPEVEAQPEIEAALIGAMTTDPNPAVRQQALIALRQSAPSEPIRRALVNVLLHDENARIRIDAIHALQTMAGQAPIEADLAQELEKGLAHEDSPLIQRKTRDFLERAGYAFN